MGIHQVDDLRQFGQSPVAKPAALRVMRFWGASDRTARDSVLLAAAVLLLLVIARRPAGAVDAGYTKLHPETGAEFVLIHPHLWLMHVWAWYPNPLGIYAE